MTFPRHRGLEKGLPETSSALNLMSPCCLDLQPLSPTFDFILSAVSPSSFLYSLGRACVCCMCMFGWEFACVWVRLCRSRGWRLPSGVFLDRFLLLDLSVWTSQTHLCPHCAGIYNWLTPICPLGRFWSHKLQFSRLCGKSFIHWAISWLSFPFAKSLPYN